MHQLHCEQYNRCEWRGGSGKRRAYLGDKQQQSDCARSVRHNEWKFHQRRNYGQHDRDYLRIGLDCLRMVRGRKRFDKHYGYQFAVSNVHRADRKEL